MLSSSAALLVLFGGLFVLGAAAHRDWWVQGLPDCWQGCLGATDDGCKSTECICKTTEDNASYLPGAVACAASQCSAAEWALELVLGPLQLYCAAIEAPIPEHVMEAAYAAATEMVEQPTQTTHLVRTSTEPKQNDHKSTSRTTMTRTTTDASGNTLQVVVPVVMGPTGISTGKAMTSTVNGGASSTRTSASMSASPTPTAGSFSPALTPATPSSTSAARSQATERPANGNGSPFDNMQAGAERWAVSAPLMGLSAVALLFGSY